MQTPYTIGITGGSGSGKTYFLDQLASRFSTQELCLISQDHYYKSRDLQIVDPNGVKNFDVPTAIERERFHKDIIRLKKGETITIMGYTFNNPSIPSREIKLEPAPFLIIEGLFVQYFDEIEKELDLKIFIEAKDHIKLGRRIKRDNDERGYDLQDVLYRYQYHVMPIYESLIEPLKHNADIVIPNNGSFDRALNLITAALKSKIDLKT